MSSEPDPIIRSRENFYKKVRHYLEEVEDNSDFTEPQPPIAKFRISDEDPSKYYGVIKPAEMEKILEAYERRQNKANLKDLPVVCDDIKPNSFEKLLFSKPAFHHLNSTNYLLEELGIKDYSRNSFLGGLSNYDVKNEDLVSGIRKQNKEIRFKLSLEKFDKFLAEGNREECKKILDELCDLDYEHPDLLHARGQLYVADERYDDAIRVLQRSYNSKKIQKTGEFISECLYRVGASQFHKGQIDLALESFKESVKYNPENHGSRLHVAMCVEKIQQRHRGSFTSKPAYRK